MTASKDAKLRQIASILKADEALDEELTFVTDNQDDESDGDVCERCFKTRADHVEGGLCTRFK